MNASLLERITIEPGKCGGRPCIRGMRIRVNDILEMLGEGVSMEEVLADFPDLEREDILACLQFAARRTDIVRLAAGNSGSMRNCRRNWPHGWQPSFGLKPVHCVIWVCGMRPTWKYFNKPPCSPASS